MNKIKAFHISINNTLAHHVLVCQQGEYDKAHITTNETSGTFIINGNVERNCSLIISEPIGESINLSCNITSLGNTNSFMEVNKYSYIVESWWHRPIK